MSYKIMMYIPRLNRTIEMPHDKGLSFYEALYRVRLYERRNKDVIFSIEEEEA